MKIYKFSKKGKDWYIDLPEYLEQGGNEGDLQMIDGADKMLNIMAGKNDQVTLSISQEHFDGADRLILTEKCDPYIGGGNYLMTTFKGQEINQAMWLCQVTDFVFGDIPDHIYIRQES